MNLGKRNKVRQKTRKGRAKKRILTESDERSIKKEIKKKEEYGITEKLIMIRKER